MQNYHQKKTKINVFKVFFNTPQAHPSEFLSWKWFLKKPIDFRANSAISSNFTFFRFYCTVRLWDGETQCLSWGHFCFVDPKSPLQVLAKRGASFLSSPGTVLFKNIRKKCNLEKIPFFVHSWNMILTLFWYIKEKISKNVDLL